MLNLSTTGSLIQCITGSAGTIRSSYSYVDDLLSGPTFSPNGAIITVITAATTTTVVPAPASGTIRNVKSLIVSNTDASVANAVTVQQTDGTNTNVLWSGTLAVGERVSFDETGQFVYYGADGTQKLSTGSGQYIATTVLTTGTTFTTGTKTRSLRLRMVGGGGAGGGCTSVAASAAAAGGGGAGAYAERVFTVSPSTGYTYAIGALGAGASGALGGSGGSTTFAVGGTTVTAPGGTGGPVGTAVTTLSADVGGAGGAIATNGTLNATGMPGETGIVLLVATPIGSSGAGGSGPFGGGGLGISAVGNGNAGLGFGSGGGGAFTGASTVRTGGSGTAGCIVVDEYT